MAKRVDELVVEGKTMSSAIRYGVAQALLNDVARSKRIAVVDVTRDEYDTVVEIVPVAMFAKSGDDRYANVEKMILK